MRLQKTTFTLTVLSDRDITGSIERFSLRDVLYEITDGSCSGNTKVEFDFISKEQMEKELMAQGSDPEFLLSEE